MSTTSDINYHIGNRLKQLCKDRGLSQTALSAAIKGKTGITISRQNINSLINNKSVPNIDTLCTLADFFEVSIDYLLEKTDFTNVGNKEIYEITGLENEAIDRLKRLNDSDKERELYNCEHLLDEYVNPYPIRLAIINFMLQSKSLEVLCDTFQEYIDADCYTDFIADIGEKAGKIKELYATSKTGIVKQINVNELLNKATIKRAFDMILDSLVDEWNKQNTFEDIAPEIYKELLEKGYHYNDITKALLEALNDNPKSKEVLNQIINEKKKELEQQTKQ